MTDQPASPFTSDVGSMSAATVTITLPMLERALRAWLTDVDYDLHRAMECDEETGEDAYPDEAEGVFEHLQRIAAGTE